MSILVRFLAAAAAALLLSACNTIPTRGEQGQDESEAAEPSGTVEAIPLEDEGLETLELQEQAPEPEAEIEADLREALSSQPPFRQAAYLDAARKLVEVRRFEDAEAVLNRVIVSGLPRVHFARKRMLQAAIFFHRNELDRARRYIDAGLRRSDIDPTYIARGLDLRARIDMYLDQPLEAARAWTRRDDYLTDDQAVAANNERIWFALGHLNELELQLAGQSGADAALLGWLDLAILFLESSNDSHGLHTAVSQWRRANPAHPAADFAGWLLGPERSPGVRQIGLLLPLSSSYGAAAQIVYNGFDAAHTMDGHPRRPQVVFYDTGGEDALVGNYVGAAASAGADVIVGPLGKKAVTTLLESRQPPKPMVLLGSAPAAESQAAPGFQFDLAPEPEARRVAEFMYASGHRRVAVLYPDDEWGGRLHQAFVEHWRTLGGSIGEARPFDPDADDHTAPIKNLFNLTESETRRKLLEARSGLNLHFESRRRRDIDALFMAARPDEARLLKPQINFFQGHDLPVYSTSHVYSGTPDAVKDTDLDGITFPGMPWVLRNTARVANMKGALTDRGFPNVSNELFAFGFDAYRLALLAPEPALPVSAGFKGLTANLVVDERGRLQRRMDWARFREGVPVLIWRH